MSGTRGKKREAAQGVTWLGELAEFLRSGALGVATALAVLAVAAMLISFGVVEQGRGDGAVVAACLLGSFLGGAIAVRRRTGAALLRGLGSGCVVFLLLLGANGLLGVGAPVARLVWTVAGACVCGGGLAGMLMGRPRKKRRG